MGAAGRGDPVMDPETSARLDARLRLNLEPGVGFSRLEAIIAALDAEEREVTEALYLEAGSALRTLAELGPAAQMSERFSRWFGGDEIVSDDEFLAWLRTVDCPGRDRARRLGFLPDEPVRPRRAGKGEARAEPQADAPAVVSPKERPTQAPPTSAAGRGIIPLTQWPEHHPWPSVAGLRHLVFHADTNGFAAVVRRVGRRVLIDEAAFFAWAAEHGPAPPAGPPRAASSAPRRRDRR